MKLTINNCLTIVRDMNSIEQVRSFNRTVTRRIGVLQSNFLGRNRPLGASRLLFEIGGSGIEIRRLRSRLDLDSGYTSRLLRRLENEKLIRTGTAPNDARVRFVTLSTAGKKELAVLNRLSDKEASALLRRLNEKQQSELLSAMNTVERLMKASAIRISVEDPSTFEAKHCLGEYYKDLDRRFEQGFNPKSSISAEPEELRPPHGYFVIAWAEGEAVGCGALKCHPDFGEIKRMWVDSVARGLGIGRQILGQLERLAHKRKIPVLRLETNKSLTEARALYSSSGYREVPAFNKEAYAHHWFEKKLTQK